MHSLPSSCKKNFHKEFNTEALVCPSVASEISNEETHGITIVFIGMTQQGMFMRHMQERYRTLR